jgi:SAM-dependent methyltransferase
MNTAPLIVDYVADYLIPRIRDRGTILHLDVGAGWGHLIKRLRESCPAVQSEGCDYNPDHNQTPELTIKHVDLNNEKLPYEDNTFDLVTCTEVLEHMEDFRHVVREIGRVCKTGGNVLISTPNVLNLRSRFYFLLRGFFEYFDPFPLMDDQTYYPGERHITPITFYYLAHTLLEANFGEITAGCDKEQKFSRLLYPLMGPLCRWAAVRNFSRRRRKLKRVPDDVETLAFMNNSRPILTGRTMFVFAVKKD